MTYSYHFPKHPFTSTMTTHQAKIPSVNVFIVLLTALIFFSVLSWFNFVLAFYETITKYNSNSNNNFNNKNNNNSNNKNNTLHTLGFAIIWTLITISIYYTMKWAGVLSNDNSDDENKEGTRDPLHGEEATPSDIPML